jgi:hypothetical protein
MGAGASLNVEEGGSVFEVMKAQEEVKAFYTSWVAEVVAKVQLYSTLLRQSTSYCTTCSSTNDMSWLMFCARECHV